MGFDEILLEEFYFPVTGKLENIRRSDAYDPSDLSNTQISGAWGPFQHRLEDLPALLGLGDDLDRPLLPTPSGKRSRLWSRPGSGPVGQPAR